MKRNGRPRVIIPKDKAVSAYKECGSISAAAAFLHCRPDVLKRNLDAYGVEYSLQKCEVNHSFFKSDSEETFYAAGFIAADACIRE